MQHFFSSQGPPDGMPSHAQMKEQRKQIEALINPVKGTPMENDPLMKAQLVEMEKALQMFDLMGIHKKREEEKRQGVSIWKIYYFTGHSSPCACSPRTFQNFFRGC